MLISSIQTPSAAFPCQFTLFLMCGAPMSTTYTFIMDIGIAHIWVLLLCFISILNGIVTGKPIKLPVHSINPNWTQGSPIIILCLRIFTQHFLVSSILLDNFHILTLIGIWHYWDLYMAPFAPLFHQQPSLGPGAHLVRACNFLMQGTSEVASDLTPPPTVGLAPCSSSGPCSHWTSSDICHSDFNYHS